MTDQTDRVPDAPRPGADHVPTWIRPLVHAAPRMRVPPALRPPRSGGRPSAVLVLFGEGPAGPDLLVIRRSAELRDHAGQPAFPGGALDPADGGSVRAALREAAEETGLDPAGVQVVATLPELYVRHSGYRVTPVLAWWREPCEVRPGDPREVAEVVRVPVRDLVDPANRLSVRHPTGTTGPAFRVGGMLVWGFTAALIDRLLAAAGWERPWDRSVIEDLPPDARGLADRG